jgi:hypothetical protein
MNKFPRPPTERMIKKLKQCLKKEKCFAEEMKSSLPGLYKRGLVETKMEIVNDKKLLCIYVTESGKKFLGDLEEKLEN